MSSRQWLVLLRRLVLVTLDALLIVASFWLVFSLRLAHPLPPWGLANLWLLPWAVGIGLVVLWCSGWYRGLTRYSGSHSLYGLLPRSALMVLLLLLVSTLAGRPDPPFRSFWLLFWLLFSAVAIASRIVFRDLLRLWMAQRAQNDARPSIRLTEGEVPTLVFGAGQAGAHLLTELRHNRRYRLVAVLDEDPSLWGRRLQGLPIRPPEALHRLIERHGIRQVLLAVPSASRRRRRELVDGFTAVGLSVLSMPSLDRIAAGEQVVSDVRPVAIEDLLRREPIQADVSLMRSAVSGKVVLVTGAAGSIGSELCRQILRLGPRRLVLLERSEVALYTLEQDLQELRGLVEDVSALTVPVLGDVCNNDRLKALCREHGVQVFFHAAAYKHVPLIEANACAGVANNVVGTRTALEAAFACDIERFMLISTDKAVRPTNVMGASKRVCELMVQEAAARVEAAGTGPICAMVRFGNVLGSSGSVVPLFRRQIAAGGPVTVTHPEITRFFMTIPEAVELVLQASGIASGGEVFVLDMGEPVRIVDLARQMIRLSGFSVRDEKHPDGEIPIVFIGLRAGEKLYEELLIQDSDQPTAHPLIRKAREECLTSDRLASLLEDLDGVLRRWDENGLQRVLGELVREYRPHGSRAGVALLATESGGTMSLA